MAAQKRWTHAAALLTTSLHEQEALDRPGAERAEDALATGRAGSREAAVRHFLCGLGDYLAGSRAEAQARLHLSRFCARLGR